MYVIQTGLSIFFKCTSTSLFTGGTFFLFFLIKIGTIFMNILYNTLKSGGTKDHLRQVNVSGTAPY
jgi:hypothetical protein